MLARVFKLDVLKCNCGGDLTPLGALQDPGEVKRYLKHMTRIDLEGDGTEEVIISAHPKGNYLRVSKTKNKYCVVLIRKIVNGVAKTIALYSDIEKKPEHSVFNNIELQAVADLDADGNMEIVTSFDYNEGVGHCVY